MTIPAATSNRDQFRKVIQFGVGGEGKVYQVSGWSGTEQNFTWSEGKAAVLRLPVPTDAGALQLRLKMAANTYPPTLLSQPVEVYANGKKIAQWDVSAIADFVARIPGEVTSSSPWLNLELRTPKSTSPRALGASEDTRILGVCCLELQLAKGS